MEQELKQDNTQSNERGCLLNGVLVTLLLGMGCIAVTMGGVLFVGFSSDEQIKTTALIRTVAVFLIAIFAIIAIIGTFKMKKKWGYALLAVLVASFIFFFWVAFGNGMPFGNPNLTDQQESGVGWSIITCVYDILCAVIISLSLKKMK